MQVGLLLMLVSYCTQSKTEQTKNTNKTLTQIDVETLWAFEIAVPLAFAAPELHGTCTGFNEYEAMVVEVGDNQMAARCEYHATRRIEVLSVER